MDQMCKRCQLAILEILTWIDFNVETGCWNFLPSTPAGAETGARYSLWTAWRCGDLLEDIEKAGSFLGCVVLDGCVSPEHYHAMQKFVDYSLPVGA